MKPQEWADWLEHPVTKAVIQHLEERKEAGISELLNANIAERSTEQIGLLHLMHRSRLDGLGEFLDLDDLGESLLEGAQ